MAAFDGLGKALRWLRAREDRRQYQVAEAAGVTKAMLSAYETEKQRPSLETLEKLLDGLGVSLADLYQALHYVNDRGETSSPPIRRTSSGEGEVPGDLDLKRTLGLRGSLEAEEELALREMVSGFHRFLRYLHYRVTTVPSVSGPGGESAWPPPPGGAIAANDGDEGGT